MEEKVVRTVIFEEGREGKITWSLGKIGVIDRRIDKTSPQYPRAGEKWKVEIVEEIFPGERRGILILNPVKRVEEIQPVRDGFERISGRVKLEFIPFSSLVPHSISYTTYEVAHDFETVYVRFKYSLEGVEASSQQSMHIDEAPIPREEKERLKKLRLEWEEEVRKKEEEEEEEEEEERRMREEREKRKQQQRERAIKILQNYNFSSPTEFCKRAVFETGVKLEDINPENPPKDSHLYPFEGKEGDYLIVVGDEAVCPLPTWIDGGDLGEFVVWKEVLTSKGEANFPDEVIEDFFSVGKGGGGGANVLDFIGLLPENEFVDFVYHHIWVPPKSLTKFKREYTYDVWSEKEKSKTRRWYPHKPSEFSSNPEAETTVRQKLEEELKEIKEFSFSSPVVDVQVYPFISKIETKCERKKSGGYTAYTDDFTDKLGPEKYYLPLEVHDAAIASCSIGWKAKIMYRLPIVSQFRKLIDKKYLISE